MTDGRADGQPLAATLARGASLCAHCSTPVPAARQASASGTTFCCDGCEAVYAILHERGLERYYKLRAGARGGRPARALRHEYQEFDDAEFHRLYVRADARGLRSVRLYLEGVHCLACVWLVEMLPRLIPGVASARLEFGRARATILWDPAATPLSAIGRTLGSLGYPPHPFRGLRGEDAARKDDRRLLGKLAIAGACAGNVMVISFALYGGFFHGMEASLESFLRWVSLTLTLPALVWGGSVFFGGAWRALRRRRLHMDLPLSIGLLAGAIGGAMNTIRQEGEIYFDSVTILIFLLLAGRYVQQRRQRRAVQSTELLHALFPSTARVVEAGGVRVVPLALLRTGGIVEVLAGEMIPADGTIIEGRSSVDQSLLTGESRPTGAGEGSAVFAGTTNLSARLRVRIDAAGEDTRAGLLLRKVEALAASAPPIVRLADRIAGWFVAAQLLVAAGALAYWLHADARRAGDVVVSLLVITCPCALGLATPLAVLAAMGRAARAGILVKSQDVFENLARPGTIWLDKTGTLTRGEQSLAAWNGTRETAALATAIERHSSHPLARAFLAAFGASDAGLEARAVEHRWGSGISGEVAGRRVWIGAPHAAAPCGIHVPSERQAELDSMASRALTPVAVAVEGIAVATAGFGDPLRADAASAIASLRAGGWRIGILSGDALEVVASAANALGIDGGAAYGAVTPEEKLARVRATPAPVVMVGDGVNDAAALAAATVGIAVEGGAEAALAAAHVYVARSGIAAIADLVRDSARTLRIIRANAAFAICYNAACATLAVCGAVNALVAAILMPISSLAVVGNSLRAGGKTRSPEPPAEAPARAAGAPLDVAAAPEGAPA
ncbi:MAG: heavy metal translocating P-type ATPase [Planctomycetes bacterium]|nr:heavy metal translocating P-type ATPase [Planctomycetota bacterium]